MLNQLKYIETNISLKEKTYYKMGGQAQYFATPSSLSEVVQAIHYTKAANLPIAVLGAGSNCVFSDETFEGLVISLQNLQQWWWESEEYLFVESGVTNTDVAEICLEKERAGASWMYRMPGQIGASVRMNARCYGGEMSQIVHQILTIDATGALKTYSAQNMFKGYKDTLLMAKPEIVVGVRFHFPHNGHYDDLLAHMKSCEDNRHSKKHFLYPSCGSTFKNNYEYGKPSGQIFDELGLKGTARGDAEVSMYHGNFIWNKGSAFTRDMLNLSSFMRQEAKNKLNVELNLEVQPIGAFSLEEFNSCGMENLGPYIDYKEKRYTGLFHTPQTQTQTSFPKTIFSSFFTEYFHHTQNDIPLINATVLQLSSLDDAQKNKDKPFLKWTVSCDQEGLKQFNLIPPQDQNIQKLWEYSVAELFLSHPQKDEYVEFEMTPSNQHIVLEFKGKRSQNPTSTLKQPLKIIELHETNNVYEFGCEFSFAQIEHFISHQSLKIQCALSLNKNNYWLAPYWQKSALTLKADFHQPEHFFTVFL